jgi:alcohol dehydrogenase class IV
MASLRETLAASLVGECTDVRANSPVPDVLRAADTLDELKADAVIAVGGGSAAVTARAAAILLAEKRPASELCTRRNANGEFESPRLSAAKLPQFVVPTTPSTAFVKAGSAVYDPEMKHRLALFDPKTRAKSLFLHPDFLLTAPEDLVRSASLNTMSTAIEALESPKTDPISEALLSHALRLIARHLKDVSAANIGAVENLALAAILCGRGTEQSGGGLASVLAHAIGHRSGTANGIVNAIVLPHTMRFNSAATTTTSSRIADALRTETGARSLSHIASLEHILSAVALPRRLRDIGLKREELPEIAAAAMSDWFIKRNPRWVSTPDELLGILEEAW